MYKVFFNDRIIYCGAGSKNSGIVNSLSFYVTDSKEAGNAWQIFLGDSMLRDMYFLSESDDIAWGFFHSLFQQIDAAGGLVLNSEEKLLCIKRWGKWDLPKGKMEKGEEPAQTALREVEEECGIFPLIEH
ncbi:MAG TPA: NUDIX domain-containing protein, partial [Prolixibacteraceae bacterium]|nr:NUDIX domain-containing protein [Prolixibacteraceae bacterium]